MNKHLNLLAAFVLIASISTAQVNMIANIEARKTTSLNGRWQYIVDQYETGFYDYRWKERKETDGEALWNTDVQKNKSERKEHGYSDKYSINVPGDWNHQDPKFFYYEGTLWYKRSFNYKKADANNRLYIYFGAANYRTDVYLNGKKLGMHKGGFTPFQFEISNSILKDTGNFLVVKVDNKRYADEVPTLNTDWWNYGGITRDVTLVELPSNYIQDYHVQIRPPAAGQAPATKNAVIEGWVKLNGQKSGDVTVEIPELKLKKTFTATDSIVPIQLTAKQLALWSPESPKLYTVNISTATDKVADKIGFRTVQVSGKQILLNGQPIFLRGICTHEEISQDVRRAYSEKDALQLLGYAKEMSCNMVRLAHYPHNEHMTRMADSLGLLVWSEIPVYWTIQFGNNEVLEKAKVQLDEMITRDHNRASIIIWSVGNETPVSETRTNFMASLIQKARQLDSTRLISAALEVHYNEGKNIINDPLGKYVDLVSINEYLGWYGGSPASCRTAQWETIYDKPLFFSELGAEAKAGFHADSLTVFGEEFQDWFYQEQIAMMKRMPDNYVGLSPWILVDFKSPKRNNPTYQEGWNRKGLIGTEGQKKKAFYTLKAYYDEMAKKVIGKK